MTSNHSCRAIVLLAAFPAISAVSFPGPAQGQTSTPTAAPNQTGAWHHFGPRAHGTTATPGKSNLPPKTNPRLTEMERALWAMVNHDRLDPANSRETSGGRARALHWNERLAEVARAHSRDMMEQNFFDHVDRQGKTPAARITAAGIPWRELGENIATNGGGAGEAEADFMHEPRFQHNHRANILNPKYTEVGIGIVQDRRGRYYITQDFVGTPSVTKTR